MWHRLQMRKVGAASVDAFWAALGPLIVLPVLYP
jgi:hypothetical protein